MMIKTTAQGHSKNYLKIWVQIWGLANKYFGHIGSIAEIMQPIYREIVVGRGEGAKVGLHLQKDLSNCALRLIERLIFVKFFKYLVPKCLEKNCLFKKNI